MEKCLWPVTACRCFKKSKGDSWKDIKDSLDNEMAQFKKAVDSAISRLK